MVVLFLTFFLAGASGPEHEVSNEGEHSRHERHRHEHTTEYGDGHGGTEDLEERELRDEQRSGGARR